MTHKVSTSPPTHHKASMLGYRTHYLGCFLFPSHRALRQMEALGLGFQLLERSPTPLGQSKHTVATTIQQHHGPTLPGGACHLSWLLGICALQVAGYAPVPPHLTPPESVPGASTACVHTHLSLVPQTSHSQCLPACSVHVTGLNLPHVLSIVMVSQHSCQHSHSSHSGPHRL